MASRSYSTSVTADTTITTTTETVLATLSNISTPRAAMKVQLYGNAQVTAGTATTALTPRIRRGTDATGTLIGEGNPIQGGVTAGSTSSIDIATDDAPADLANASYVLTVQATAATGNGTGVQASLRATISD